MLNGCNTENTKPIDDFLAVSQKYSDKHCSSIYIIFG